MHGIEGVASLVVVLAAASLAAVVLQRLRVPVILGFLLAGVAIGPWGLGLVEDVEAIRELAEIGVVLLLFSIGLEISPSRLWALRIPALVGGGLQVLVTAGAAFGIARWVGVATPTAVVVGFVAAVSSTAIVLKALTALRSIDAPHGRLSVAFLIFQDLAVVPMILAIPLLTPDAPSGSIGRTLLSAAAVLAVVLLLARRVVPWLLDRVAETRSREAFLLSVAVILLGTAWLTVQAGLSMALGAFLAGLVISDSEHRLLALAEAVPFRDLFTALFFVSVGMLLDLRSLAAHPWPPLATAVAIYAGKSLVVAVLVLALGYSVRTAVLTGLGLGQVGEFSFLLLLLAGSAGVMPAGPHGVLVSAAILTMIATPLVMAVAPAAAAAAARLLPGRARREGPLEGATAGGLEGHVVVVGFGLTGRNVARVLRATSIPYAIVELNPRTVREERRAGQPIHRGDATRPEVFEHLSVETARAVVVAVSDPDAARAAILLLKSRWPETWVIARAHRMDEMDGLYRLGADEVIPAEFETSIELFSRVLHRYDVPDSVVTREIASVRGERYRALREGRLPGIDALLTGLTVTPVTLGEGDAAVGRTLVELGLRARTGATAVAVVRDARAVVEPAGTALAPGDTVILSGITASVEVAAAFLVEGPAALEED